jgi:hypothetical protein
MAINLTGGLPPEILGQQQQLNRQQQMAQMLMQQGQQQPQGQMVSGRYVQPSIFAQLAPLAQMYAGQKMLERGDQKALDLAKQLRQGQGEALADYMGQLQGRPAVPEQVTQMAGPYGQGVGQGGADIPMPTAVVEGKPAVQGNRLLASMNALQNPYTPDFLRQQAIKSLTPEAFTIKEGEKRIIENPDGTFREIASGGEKQSPEYRNYLIAKNDPINPFKGGFTDYQTMLKKAGATSINMPSGEERKAGFMSTILDRNILQMQTALGVDPTAVKPNVAASVVESVTGPNLLSRSMKPAQRQIVEDSQLDVLDAALTLRTGAAYTREQLNAMRDTYFPVLGDKPDAVAQKKQRLESLLEGAYIASGRATPPRVSLPPTATLPAKPPTKPNAPTAKIPPAPAGVDPKVWNAMTPEERKLF